MSSIGLQLNPNPLVAYSQWGALIPDIFSKIFEIIASDGKTAVLTTFNRCNLVCRQWNQNVQCDSVFQKVLQVCFGVNEKQDLNFKERAMFWLNISGKNPYLQCTDFNEDPLSSKTVSYFEKNEGLEGLVDSTLRWNDLIFCAGYPKNRGLIKAFKVGSCEGPFKADSSELMMSNLETAESLEYSEGSLVHKMQFNPDKNWLSIIRQFADGIYTEVWGVDAENEKNLILARPIRKISANSPGDCASSLVNNCAFFKTNEVLKVYDYSTKNYLADICPPGISNGLFSQLELSRNEARLSFRKGDEHCIWNIEEKKLSSVFFSNGVNQSAFEGRWLESPDGRLFFGLNGEKILIYSLDEQKLFRVDFSENFKSKKLCGLTQNMQLLIETDKGLKCLSFNFPRV